VFQLAIKNSPKNVLSLVTAYSEVEWVHWNKNMFPHFGIGEVPDE